MQDLHRAEPVLCSRFRHNPPVKAGLEFLPPPPFCSRNQNNRTIIKNLNSFAPKSKGPKRFTAADAAAARDYYAGCSRPMPFIHYGMQLRILRAVKDYKCKYGAIFSCFVNLCIFTALPLCGTDA